MQELSIAEESERILDALKSSHRFDYFSENHLAEFIGLGVFRSFDRGDVIIKEGDYDCWIYFLIDGKLEITKQERYMGTLQRNGDLFGEMGVIEGKSRSATITAMDTTSVLGFDASYLDRKLKKNQHLFCYVIYRLFSEVLAKRLRETTQDNIELRSMLARMNGL